MTGCGSILSTSPIADEHEFRSRRGMYSAREGTDRFGPKYSTAADKEESFSGDKNTRHFLAIKVAHYSVQNLFELLDQNPTKRRRFVSANRRPRKPGKYGDYFFIPNTASFAALATLNFTTVFAGI